MEMTGEYRIPAPREQVWAALNDPDVLRQAIPGCEELKKISDTELEAAVRSKIGPVNARFNGKVTLSDLNPPESYRISGEGKGGAAGFAKGGADVNLTEEGAGTTLLRYTAHADVGGKLAQIGSRLVQGSAKKMADDFFGRFAEIVAGAPATGGSAAEGEAKPQVTAPAAAAAHAAAPPPVTPDDIGAEATGTVTQAKPSPITAQDADMAPPSQRAGATQPLGAAPAAAPEPEQPRPAPAVPGGAAEPIAAGAAGAAPAAASRRPEAAPGGAQPKGGLAKSPMMWVLGAIVIILVLIFALS
jgi:uncharacterized protein